VHLRGGRLARIKLAENIELGCRREVQTGRSRRRPQCAHRRRRAPLHQSPCTHQSDRDLLLRLSTLCVLRKTQRDVMTLLSSCRRQACISLIRQPSAPRFVNRGVVFATERLFVFLPVESRVVPPRVRAPSLGILWLTVVPHPARLGTSLAQTEISQGSRKISVAIRRPCLHNRQWKVDRAWKFRFEGWVCRGAARFQDRADQAVTLRR
jgi:hypothetical protein